MIPAITEVNFPSYATLHQANVSFREMGERTISTQVRIDSDVVPSFDGWELRFKGERFILPEREPQASKDNQSRRSVVDLTFQSWVVYQLKRYFFVSMSEIETGVAIPDQYNASITLSLESFVQLFNKVLKYYYGYDIRMDLFGAGTGIYSTNPVTVEIDRTYIWDVLLKFYETFDIRWRIEYDSQSSAYVIKVGYTAEAITDHDFEYGYSGGLLRFERQVQDADIKNILIGRGGEKNLPYRYFKLEDPNATAWAADPDAIPELANIHFDRIRDINFRWYVRGWMQNPNRDTSWDATHTFPVYTDQDCPEEFLFAFLRGKTDAKFNPVEYVKDDASIEKYGERWGAVDDNDEVYPTIQGVVRNGLGRVDEVVDVSPIVTDDIEAAAQGAAVENNIDGRRSIGAYVNANGNHTEQFIGEPFTVPDGKTASVDFTSVGDGRFFVSFNYSVPDAVRANVYIDTNVSYLMVKNEETGEIIPATGIPAGTYRYVVSLKVVNDNQTAVNITYGFNGVKMVISEQNQNAWKPTFDIWVKNIWGTQYRDQQHPNETPEQYSARVWEKILGDRAGSEAKVVFSDGFMSVSEDYEFVIAAYPVYDTSKEVTTDGVTYQSEWKITLYKNDAEFDATGLYIPNATTGGSPAARDHFYFIGIDMPFQYVEWAEETLNGATHTPVVNKTAALGDVAEINPTWIISLDKVRCNTHEDQEYGQHLADRLAAGATVRIKDKRFTNNAVLTLYVQSITYTWNEPTQGNPYLVPDIEVVLSDKVISVEGPVALVANELSVVKSTYAKSADIESVVRRIGNSLFLKKTGESDNSESPTTFNSKVSSKSFRQGDIGGAGWGYYEDGNGDSVLEIDHVVVRKDMRVNSIVANQITHVGGKRITSAASIECSQVIEDSLYYTCYFDQRRGSLANLFTVGDFAYGQTFDEENVEVRYYRMRVSEVGADYIKLDKSVRDGLGAPEKGDTIVQYGHDTNPARQFVIIEDVIGGGYQRMLSGLNTVSASGNEYYFAGKQNSAERWFVGNVNGEHAEWLNGQLNITGRLSVRKSDGTYQAMDAYISGMNTTIENLQAQIDGQIQSWASDGEPYPQIDGGEANYPASSWEDTATKLKHMGDIYVDNSTGQGWRYTRVGETSTFYWMRITDEELAQALQDIQELQQEFAGLEYLKAALDESTVVQGGLVLTSLIQLGKTVGGVFSVYSGINGVVDTTKLGDGIAAWYGGPMTDHEADPSAASYAKSLFRFNGSGYLAGGRIKWGADGAGSIPGITWTSGNEIIIGGNVKLENESGDTVTELISLVQQFSSFFERVNIGTEQNPVYAIHVKSGMALYSDSFLSAGGLNSGGGGGGGVDLLRVWQSLTNNPSLATVTSSTPIALAHIPDIPWSKILNKPAAKDLSDGDELSYVDPNEGEEITIDVPGTTGTVLWGAESANNVALDVNGVSKMLVKQAALDGINSSISNLSSLIGTKQDYISDLSSIRSNASLGATAYSWGDHRTFGYATQSWVGQQGYLTSVPTASANTLGIIRIGTGLTIDGNGIVSVTGQTQGTVTGVKRASDAQPFSPDVNGVVTLPDYPVVPTAVSAFTNDAGYITKAVNDLVNYYTKSETYDRATIDSLIGSINQFHYEIYPSTSSVTNPKSNVLYLIGPTGSGSDKYEEYVYVSGNWTKIGDTSIDLAPYLTIASAQATYQPIISNLQTIIARADEGHTVYGYFSNGILGLEHIPLDERLSYVDPEEGEEITIDVPGTTGTVLWGAESQYNVALDVNGVSKMLLKAGALDNVYTRLGSLEANFVNGYAVNALQLEGHGANFFATASGLSSLASTVAGLVTGVSSVVGQGGDVTVSQIASALTSAGYKLTDTIYTLPEATSGALGGIKIGYSESGRNYAVQLSDGKAFVNVPWTDTVYTLPTASRDVLGGIKIGNGLAIDSNGVVSVTGQTQGTVTRVDVGSTQYEPNVDGIVSLPAYPTTLPASDVYAWAKAASKPSYAFSEITGSATASQLPAIENLTHFGTRVYDASASRTANTVLAAPNGSNGAATFRALVAADIPSITTGKISDLETWIDDKEFITKAVNDLTNYYKKTETYTQSEVNALIAAINQFHYEIAASTSAVTDPKSNVLYLIGPTGSGSDKYEEYVYTTQWVKIGDTSIDLTPYLLASVAAQTYVPLTRTVNGHALSSDVTVTKGDVGLGNVDNLAASAYFTEFANGTGADANKVLITIGTTQKKLTVAFASNSDTLDGHDSAYFATASDVNTLFSYFDANGVANSAARLSGASALNIWGVEYWANGVPKAVTGRPNLYLARTQVNTSAANDTLLGITAISNASSSGDSDKSRIVWDATNEAWHFIGNVYADGFISSGGLNEGGSGGGVDLSRVWQSLSNSAATFTPGDNSKIATAHLPSLSGTGVSAQYSSTGSGATLATVLNISLVASGVTAGTYTKVTVDQYGRATAGTTLAASDIPTLAISKISGLQTALDNKQPLDADLTAIAGLSGTSGFLKKTAANTWTLDTNTYALASSLDNYVPTSRTVNGKALSANISLAAADLSDAARLLFVDPEEGEEVTIEDPGTTGTVLWGAESANQVALDVNGVSKTLVKMQALDGIRSSITTILGYFSGSSAYNALALEGHGSSYFATSTALSDLSSAVSALVTGVSSVAGKTGAVSLVITDIGGLQDALNGKQAAGNYVNTIGGKYGVITLGSGLEMSDSGELSVTGQTIGTVTSVGLSMPTGFSVASSPITSSGTLSVSFASGYSLPSDAAQAAWTAKYDKPSGGIPKTDLASAVQASLGLADSALQSHQTVTLAGGTNNGTLKITTAAGTTDNVAVTGLGTAAYRGVATTIGASITNLVPGSLLYSVLGGAFDSSNTVVDFVNSSIATATATFRGTNDTATTEADFLTWANALTKTLNDYVFWKTTDSAGNVVFKRYKYGYDGTEAGSLAWRYEYDLNNSSFTAAQWSAINSGITSTLVSAFNAKYDKPVGGIPKTDLASAVQTSLGLADTALQPAFAGSSNIVTLGTITTGVWHGSQITQDYLSDIGWTFVRNSATYDTEDYIHVNS